MCTYCGCRATPLIKQWSDEHEAIVNALGDLRRCVPTGGAPLDEARMALRALLVPHTDLEERTLFAHLREQDEFADAVTELCAEHEHIDAALDAVTAGDHASYDALEHLLRRHIDKEENGIFPAAVIALTGDAWGEMEQIA